MWVQLYEPTLSDHELHPSGNGTERASILQPPQPTAAVENAVSHILVAVRLDAQESEAVTLALRMAASHRARVTLLHVIAPYAPVSVHWLDAIDNLHRALSGQSRDDAAAMRQGQSSVVEFLDRKIPLALREPLDLRVECPIGDVAAEIAKFTDEQSVDLVFLCDRPSGWRPSIWPSLSQRIVQLNSKPIVFARPQAKRTGNGA